MIKINDKYHLVKDDRTVAFHLMHSGCFVNAAADGIMPNPGYVTSLLPNDKRRMWIDCYTCKAVTPEDTFNKAHFIIDS